MSMRYLSLAALLAAVVATADAQQIGGGGGGGGGVTFPLTAPNGSSAAPSYSFTNGTDSGIYASANGSVTVVGSAGSVGGSVALTGGTPTSGTTAGGNVTISAGAPNGGAAGGGVTINAGNAVNTAGSGPGSVTISAGNAQPNSSGGGTVTISGGNGATGHIGGNLILTGGAINGGTQGGAVNITSGAANGVNITAGISGNGGTINLTPYGGFATSTSGSGATAFDLEGLGLFAFTGTGNGADTTEDTLASSTLPANTLSAQGQCVRITSWGTTANNADNKTIRLYFGTFGFSSGTAAFTNSTYWMQVTACKNSSQTVQSIVAFGFVGTTVIAPAFGTTGGNTTSAIVVKTTGQAGAANASDIVSQGQLVEIMS